jgi:hypothetical protein
VRGTPERRGVDGLNGRGPWPWWLALVRDFGFPIMVAGWVLFRLDATLEALTREVHLLAVEVAKLGARLAALPIP